MTLSDDADDYCNDTEFCAKLAPNPQEVELTGSCFWPLLSSGVNIRLILGLLSVSS